MPRRVVGEVGLDLGGGEAELRLRRHARGVLAAALGGSFQASTLAAIKAASHAKDAREKRDTDFHKTALVLAREYLRANGYSKSCDALAKEVGSGLEKLELADNVDLGSVIREFDSYYQLKLGRPPKLLRRRDNENKPPKPPGVYERRKRGAARAAAEKAERVERPREAG